MRPQQRWMCAISGSAEWKPKLRWLIRRMRLARAFEAAVCEAEPDRVQDAFLVLLQGAGEFDERFQLRVGGGGEPGVQ
jgi:hypothetical protein